MNERDIFAPAIPDIYQVRTKAKGPAGQLPLDAEMLLNQPSGNIFGLTQNAGMGWNPEELGRKQFLVLSTQGGLRAPTDSQSRWVITLDIGKLVCSWKRRALNCGG
jgi:hypothetical protein